MWFVGVAVVQVIEMLTVFAGPPFCHQQIAERSVCVCLCNLCV